MRHLDGIGNAKAPHDPIDFDSHPDAPSASAAGCLSRQAHSGTRVVARQRKTVRVSLVLFLQILQISQWVAETDKNLQRFECLRILAQRDLTTFLSQQARERAQAKADSAGGVCSWSTATLFNFISLTLQLTLAPAGSQLKSNAAALSKSCAICKVRQSAGILIMHRIVYCLFFI